MISRSRRLFLVAAIFALVAVVGACASSNTATNPGSGSSAVADSGTSPATEKATINVFAASSLTEAFDTIKRAFAKQHPGITVVPNYQSSSDLVKSIGAGNPADVLATADEKNMATAKDQGLVGKPTIFTRNRLTILVKQGNPKQIDTVADLDKDGVSYVLCAAEVPCGKFGKRIVDKAGVKAQPVSLEPNVKATAGRVARGDVDAGLVYVTDVKPVGNGVDGVTIPDDLNQIAAYPIALTTSTKESKAAQEFVDFVLSPAGQKVLRADGFLPGVRRAA